MNLNKIERQRAKIYKQQLKEQFQKQKIMKQLLEAQNKQKQRQQIQRQRKFIIQEERLNRQKSKELYQSLTNQNKLIIQTKGHLNFINSQTKNNISLLDELYNSQNSRIKSWKQHQEQMKNKNNQEENFQKQNSIRYKQIQKKQQEYHLNRLKELQSMRRNQYQKVKSKHIQDMKIYDRHKKLIQLNEQYKSSLQEFAYKGKDILDSLKRNDNLKIRQMKKVNQKDLQNQISEKRSQSSFQKSQTSIQKNDLQKSLFKEILFKNNKINKKEYQNQLLDQIKQKQKKEMQQKNESIKKVEINSIYGGIQGQQRLKMIQYVDLNLGIQANYMKSLPEHKKNFRLDNIYHYRQQKEPAEKRKGLINKIQNILTNNPEKQKKNQVKYHDLSKSYNFTERYAKNQVNQLQDKKFIDNKQIVQPKKFTTYDTITGKQKNYQF